MKRSQVIFFILFIMFLSGCSSERDQLVGVWKVSNVSITADSGVVSGEEILAVENSQKSVSFELFKDSTINLIAGGSAVPGIWYYDENKAEVYVTLDGSFPSDSIILGKYDHGVIIKNEKHAFGELTSVFEKR